MRYLLILALASACSSSTAPEPMCERANTAVTADSTLIVTVTITQLKKCSARLDTLVVTGGHYASP